MLLLRAPQDRAWRRRAFLVMCRARHAKLRPPPPRKSQRIWARIQRGVVAGWATPATTVRAGSSSNASTGQEHGSPGGLAWLLEPANDDVFRLIVGFL